jgi:hypothetical protein
MTNGMEMVMIRGGTEDIIMGINSYFVFCFFFNIFLDFI